MLAELSFSLSLSIAASFNDLEFPPKFSSTSLYGILSILQLTPTKSSKDRNQQNFYKVFEVSLCMCAPLTPQFFFAIMHTVYGKFLL